MIHLCFPSRTSLDYPLLRVKSFSGVLSDCVPLAKFLNMAVIWSMDCHLAPVSGLLASPVLLVIYVLGIETMSVSTVSNFDYFVIYTSLHP